MRAACTSVLFALWVIAALAQQPTFRSDTRIVPVLATVHGADGRLVPDLQKDDFTIFDNGRRQEIAVFENSVQPVTVVVMLDFSGSMTKSLPLLKLGAEQFLVRMQPMDQGQVGAFSDRIMFSGTFTNDRDGLIRALEDLQSGNPTALYDAIDASIDKLIALEGRRVVLVFTDGEDNFSKRKFKDVRDRARDKDILIYAIGLHSQAGAQLTRPDPDLEKLAYSTGGGYFELNAASDLAPTFTRVAQEIHSQYLLGFSPEKLDGREHKIEVRLKDPTMKVRARNNYIASREQERAG
jgi:Ca-activated chloride channel homolog